MTDTTPPPNPPGYGPIEKPPTAHLGPTRQLAELLAPLHGIDLGDYDHKVIGWLAREDSAVAMTVVSLLHRARAANPLGDPE